MHRSSLDLGERDLRSPVRCAGRFHSRVARPSPPASAAPSHPRFLAVNRALCRANRLLWCYHSSISSFLWSCNTKERSIDAWPTDPRPQGAPHGPAAQAPQARGLPTKSSVSREWTMGPPGRKINGTFTPPLDNGCGTREIDRAHKFGWHKIIEAASNGASRRILV